MRLKHAAFQFMNTKLWQAPITPEQAVADAEAFDLIVATPNAYKASVEAMKAANPRLDLAVYQNATFTWHTNWPDRAYAADKDGHRVEPKGWPGTYLLNPRAPEAQQAMADDCAALLAQSGYTDLYLDVCGPAPLNPGYVSALPVDPLTSLPWTWPDWNEAVRELVTALRPFAPRKPYQNSFVSGTDYFGKPTSITFDKNVKGAVAESWIRSETQPLTQLPGVDTWTKALDQLRNAEAKGCRCVEMVKTWAKGTEAQKDAWYVLAAATFLLATDGRSYLVHTRDPGVDNTRVWPLADLWVGTPDGACYQAAPNVWQRDFARGSGEKLTRVVVNMSPDPYPAPLAPGDWVSLPDEAAHTASAMVAPKTGAVFHQP